jgi:hypothetical protein
MSFYLNQEFDFVQRTKTIIEQYKDFPIPEKEKFEATLLINCLVGLIMLPQQHWYDSLPTDILNGEEWGIKSEQVTFIKPGEQKNVKNIARHLRNSIAHYRFKAFDDSTGKISSFHFKDCDTKHNKTFETKIPLSDIAKFAKKLSDIFLSEMLKQK